MVSLYSSPACLADEVDDYLNLPTTNIKERVSKILADFKEDMYNAHRMTKVVDLYTQGNVSDEELYAAYNKYRSWRGRAGCSD